MELMNFNINEFKNLDARKWMLGNKILYDLCSDHPKNNDPEEIRAKIWLIGRSYAASIERRKIKKHINDDFYEYVTNEFVKFNKKTRFDEKLNKIKNVEFNQESLKSILIIHKELTDFFKEITGLEKRSLASKYLHFHVPIFPIYDSRVNKVLNNLVKGRIKSDLIDGDESYSKFCLKLLFLYEHIKKEIGDIPQLRKIDTFLIENANKNLRDR